MPHTFVRNLTSGTSKTSSTTVTVTVPANIPAGSLVVVAAAIDNSALTTPTLSSITIPAGETNSWQTGATINTNSGTPASNSDVQTVVRWIITTVQWNAAQVLTLTFSASKTAKAAVGMEFTSGTGTTMPDAATTGGSATGAHNITRLAANIAVDDLLIGVVSAERETAVPADTNAGSGAAWQTGVVAGTSGSTADTNVSIRMQYKIATASSDSKLDMSGAALGVDSHAAIVRLTPPAYVPELDIYVGSTNLAAAKIKIGASNVDKVFVGSTRIFG